MTLTPWTKAGNMDWKTTIAVPQVTMEKFESLLPRWQAAVNDRHYNAERFTHPADQVHGYYGGKYARLDVGGSGAFMVEMETGIIFAIKGYGKVDRAKIIGNAYDPNFDAAVLVRDRFRYGHFENNQDGSLRQPIVRR